jgi:putative FmdB family regulatory protein
MPTYEYECDKCGGQFEVFQSIKDAPKEVCDS